MKAERSRLVKYCTTYYEQSAKPDESVTQGSGAAQSTGSAKGIAVRKTKNGPTGLTEQGTKSLSAAGQVKKQKAKQNRGR